VDAGTGTVIIYPDIDDTPVNGATTVPVTSNWAFDHNANTTTAHSLSTTYFPLAGGTMSGNVLLAENVSIDLDPALSADEKYSGLCETGVAGATLVFGQLCYYQHSDNRWELTDANTRAKATGQIAICVLAAANDGDVPRCFC